MLDMIRGLVRPITTVLVIASIIALTFLRIIEPEHLVSIGSMMVGFWFGQRGEEKAEQRAEVATEAIAAVARQQEAQP